MAYIANSTPFKIADTATFDTAKEAIDYTFVITGKLSKPRDYYKKLIEENGGKVVFKRNLLCED